VQNQAFYRTGIFSLAGGNFAFSKREFPVALFKTTVTILNACLLRPGCRYTCVIKVMFYLAFVCMFVCMYACPSVCLSVCLSVLATSRKNYGLDVRKNFTRDVSVN